MGNQQGAVPARRRVVGVRSIVLLAFVAASATLCYLNRAAVPIRPFGSAPLYQLLLAACAAGLIVGWSLAARFTGWRMRRGRKTPVDATPVRSQPEA